MRKIWAICRREFTSYFITPIGYVVLATYALITGLGFTAAFVFYARVSQNPAEFEYPGVPGLEETMLSPFLVFCGQILMFLGPLITMRLLAEERNKGTMELLLTQPLRDRDIIFGKYLSALGMVGVMMGVVAIHMLMVVWYTDVEPAVLLFGLLGVFLMGAAFMSLGLFVSALSGNQITAGAITFGLFFVSYVLGALAKEMSEVNPAPSSWGDQTREIAGAIYSMFRQIVQELPIDAHARDMAQGIVQPQDIAYYVLFSAFFLFLTFRALESRKWRSKG